MPLTLVATPIGNKDDFTVRGLEFLRKCDVIIVEEFKESTQWLRQQSIVGKELLQLNEHSSPADIEDLSKVCFEKNVALITDCGTPGFADPGAELIKICRQKNIPVKSLPGPSSLMTLLSLSSQKLDQFIFRGFLSAENELRQKQWKELSSEKRAIVLMDTPYRLEKTVNEVKNLMGQRKILLAVNLTQENEFIFDDKAQLLQLPTEFRKAEFMLLIYPA